VRRLRYGRPIVVVSGLPRSGTSMAMKMLEAGGIPLLSDGIRTADESNPGGYFEFEPVKELHKQGDTSWLADARGKAVKIVSFMLTWLPETYDYNVIFMRRDLSEVVASEIKMLLGGGELPEPDREQATRRVYEEHLEKVARFLSQRRCFSSLTIEYRDALERPEEEARRISDFLGVTLDVQNMARVVDPRLYRNRRRPDR
jgi:hypothetical protein